MEGIKGWVMDTSLFCWITSPKALFYLFIYSSFFVFQISRDVPTFPKYLSMFQVTLFQNLRSQTENTLWLWSSMKSIYLHKHYSISQVYQWWKICCFSHFSRKNDKCYVASASQMRGTPAFLCHIWQSTERLWRDVEISRNWNVMNLMANQLITD